jgi:hypothetical protein
MTQTIVPAPSSQYVYFVCPDGSIREHQVVAFVIENASASPIYWPQPLKNAKPVTERPGSFEFDNLTAPTLVQLAQRLRERVQ